MAKPIIIVATTATGWIAKARGSDEHTVLRHSLDASMFDVAADVQRDHPEAMVCFESADPRSTVGTRD